MDAAAAAGWAERNQRSPPLPATLRLQDTHVSRQLLTLRLPNKGESLCLYFSFFYAHAGLFYVCDVYGQTFSSFFKHHFWGFLLAFKWESSVWNG